MKKCINPADFALNFADIFQPKRLNIDSIVDHGWCNAGIRIDFGRRCRSQRWLQYGGQLEQSGSVN